MPKNTRFAAAVHVLTLLALNKAPLTSDYIAGSVCTNAVVVRRLLGRLREAGLVSAVQGAGGGFALAVDPRSLTLRMVYEAVDEREMIAIHSDPNPRCPVGRNIGDVLHEVTSRAERAMLDALSSTTVAQLTRRVKSREAVR
jgi:Rrf2 family protein